MDLCHLVINGLIHEISNSFSCMLVTKVQLYVGNKEFLIKLYFGLHLTVKKLNCVHQCKSYIFIDHRSILVL